MDLDKCRALRHGRVSFPFASEIFCLFFERFPEMRPKFDHRPPRPITEVRIHMWGEMMPKRGLPEYSTKMATEALVLLVSEDDHAFVALEFSYIGVDWR